MSTKFEQLLDLIVNEEMDKANELFHEIVVEKSREIYENMIADEADDEADDKEVDEGEYEDEDEMSLEDSYSMEADDEIGGDAADDLELDVEMGDDDEMGDDEMGDDEMGDEFSDDEPGDSDDAMMDIKNAIAELEAAFAELESSKDSGMDDDEFGDEEPGVGDDDDVMSGDMMGKPAMEGRRMTREYTEKVGNDWEKNSQKAQGHYAGAGTGDKEGSPVEGKSPISSGSGKPTSGANAKNLAQSGVEGQSNTGTSPGKVHHGITPSKGEKMASGMHNVDGAKSGVKTLSKVAGGHGAEKKGAGPGPVGSGTGDKAGQTSVDPATSKQFLPQYGKK